MDAPAPIVAPDALLLLGAGAVALVGAVAGVRIRRWRAASRLQARMARARRREAEAEALLERAGYTILDAQVTVPCPVEADGEVREPIVRADYLVRRWGRTYVAEAKSGPRATDVTERATRRQLLEYAVTYDVDGVLLVDTEAGRVVVVRFPALRRAGPRPGLLAAVLAIGIAVGAVIGRLLG